MRLVRIDELRPYLLNRLDVHFRFREETAMTKQLMVDALLTSLQASPYVLAEFELNDKHNPQLSETNLIHAQSGDSDEEATDQP